MTLGLKPRIADLIHLVLVPGNESFKGGGRGEAVCVARQSPTVGDSILSLSLGQTVLVPKATCAVEGYEWQNGSTFICPGRITFTADTKFACRFTEFLRTLSRRTSSAAVTQEGAAPTNWVSRNVAVSYEFGRQLRLHRAVFALNKTHI